MQQQRLAFLEAARRKRENDAKIARCVGDKRHRTLSRCFGALETTWRWWKWSGAAQAAVMQAPMQLPPKPDAPTQLPDVKSLSVSNSAPPPWRSDLCPLSHMRP